METIKNVTQLLVAKNISKTATANLVIETYDQIADGEVCVVDPRTNKQVTSAGYTDGFPACGFKLIQRSGTKLIHSDIIKPGTIRSMTISLPANNAAAEQIDYVGFNGTSGALDVINNNLYTIRLYILDSTIMGFMQQKVKEGFYKSNSAATESDIAAGLVNSLIANYKREPVQNILFERVSSATTVASSGGVWSVTKNSKFVKVVESAGSAADAGKYDSDGSILTVGDFIRFGHATTKTYPIYRIVSISGAGTATCTIELDAPYQGTSNVSLAATSVGCMASATGLAGDFGIKISGVSSAYDGKFFGMPVTFKTTVNFSDEQTTTVTNAQTASVGTGNYDVLARLEKELQADEYVYRVFLEGAPVDRTDVISGTTYDVVTIEYDHIEVSSLGVEVRSPKTLVIAQAGNGAQADVAAIGWLTLLNHIVVTTWATPGVSSLTPTA